MQEKRDQFRLEIRRKQINQFFTTKRLQFHEKMEVQKSANKQIGMQEKTEQFSTLLSCLSKNVIDQDFYRILENLREINQFLKKQSKSGYIQSYVGNSNLVEELVKGLKCINPNTPDGQRQNLSSLTLKILSKIIDLEGMTSQKIIKSKLMEEFGRILQYPFNNAEYISNMLWVIGISMDKNPQIAEVVADEKLIDGFIYLMVQLTPSLQDELLHNFILLIKFFLQEISGEWVPKFTTEQSEVLFKAAYPTIFLFNTYNFNNQTLNPVMEDAVYVLKMLMEKKIIKFNRPDVHYRSILEIISIRDAPHTVKKEILYLLDYVIYADDDNFLTEELVIAYELLMNIWGVEDDLKIISLNIMANIALIPSLKFKLIGFLPAIILNLNFSPKHAVFIFLLNYFHSQNYEIQTQTDEKIVRCLQEIKSTSSEIVVTEVKIWSGLAMHGFEGVIPQRVIHASCPEVELLKEILEKKSL